MSTSDFANHTDHGVARVTASLPFSVGGPGLPLPQPGRGREIIRQVLIASLWCTSVTPQWQRPWCKGWPGTHLHVLRRSERAWYTRLRQELRSTLWTVLWDSTTVAQSDPPEPSEPNWVAAQATRCVHQQFHDTVCWPELSDPDIWFQGNPQSGVLHGGNGSLSHCVLSLSSLVCRHFGARSL